MKNLIGSVLNDSARHFRGSADIPNNDKIQTLRARHIKDLINRDPGVTIDYSDPKYVKIHRVERHRDRPGDKGSLWMVPQNGNHRIGINI
jgi:hypothetical protein